MLFWINLHIYRCDATEALSNNSSLFKNYAPNTEREALKALTHNREINIKKADKGTTILVMNAQDKKQEGQIQLDNISHYSPLETPMVAETKYRVNQLIDDLGTT